MGLIFFGNERLATSVTESGVILKSLIDNGYPVTHLVVNQNRITSRKRKDDKVIEIANKHNIQIISSWDEDMIGELASHSQAGVLASFGRIIKPSLITSFKRGIINIHPSLLPELRGSTPIETTILNRQQKAGVSLMALDKKMDSGRIYDQQSIAINQNVTKQELYDELSNCGAKMLINNLDNILSGKNSGHQQDDSAATYCSQIDKNNAIIDWNNPAEVIEAQIRAYLGWPGSKTSINNREITITKAKIIYDMPELNKLKPGEYLIQSKKLYIGCQKDSLEICSLKPANRSEMDAGAFISGLQIKD